MIYFYFNTVYSKRFFTRYLYLKLGFPSLVSEVQLYVCYINTGDHKRNTINFSDNKNNIEIKNEEELELAATLKLY